MDFFSKLLSRGACLIMEMGGEVFINLQSGGGGTLLLSTKERALHTNRNECDAL